MKRCQTIACLCWCAVFCANKGALWGSSWGRKKTNSSWKVLGQEPAEDSRVRAEFIIYLTATSSIPPRSDMPHPAHSAHKHTHTHTHKHHRSHQSFASKLAVQQSDELCIDCVEGDFGCARWFHSVFLGLLWRLRLVRHTCTNMWMRTHTHTHTHTNTPW